MERGGQVAIPCGVPYRVDIACPPDNAIDILVELGALDVEPASGGLAAILPDGVTPDILAGRLGTAGISASPATARDSGSVWLLGPRPVRAAGITIATPDAVPAPGVLRLIDSGAFGTGHHPTTALCIEAIGDIVSDGQTDSILDVGTGSGILALAALMMGVPRAMGLDIDTDALAIAAENARLNGVESRFELVHGGPESVKGNWPLVVANVLAAPLIEMAPVLVRRLRSGGKLVLSGIPESLAAEVRKAYQHFGLQRTGSAERAGWTVLIARASW